MRKQIIYHFKIAKANVLQLWPETTSQRALSSNPLPDPSSKREKRKRETSTKYERWYAMVPGAREELTKDWDPNPNKEAIAKLISMKEVAAGKIRGTSPGNILRRLNDIDKDWQHYNGPSD